MIVLSAAWSNSFGSPEAPAATATNPPPITPSIASNLLAHVEALATRIGQRNLFAENSLVSSADYIEKNFISSGYEVRRQEYVLGEDKVWNIEVELAGTSPAVSNEIVVVGAHYDTAYRTPGADDNASGVAGLLELARVLQTNRFDRTVRFVAFVNEEPPFFKTWRMGSLVYAKRCRERKEKITGMFALEMIGYYSDAKNSQSYPPGIGLFFPSTGDFVAFVADRKSKELLKKAATAFSSTTNSPKLETTFMGGLVPGLDLSDHWSFWQNGFPAVMVTDTAMFRNKNYHRSTDTPEKLDYLRMEKLVHGMVPVITELSTHRKQNAR